MIPKEIVLICMVAIWIHPLGKAEARELFVDSGHALGDHQQQDDGQQCPHAVDYADYQFFRLF